jgi:L-ribulose-5-phosphate 4-epimerase
MLEELKRQVCDANLALVREGLVIQTFGNVSGVDRAKGMVIIKPSGMPYERMMPEHMVVVSLETGAIVEGDLRPSSDTPTHLVLYRAFAAIGGIAHTHSLFATVWAQSRRGIPPLGTTHADYWNGAVPCTRAMRPEEISTEYEVNTGRVIVETFGNLDPLERPAVLVASHGPFAWGEDARAAAQNAIALEFVAKLAAETLRLAPETRPMQPELLEKHFKRKHGPKAYYGQK